MVVVWLLVLRRGRQALVLVAGLVMLQGPWIGRNAVTFGEFVPTSTSSGLNLFRGHNADEYGAWTNESIEREIARLPVERDYELRMNDIYVRYATEHMRSHPGDEILSLGKKMAYLWILNPLEPRSRSPFYVVPWAGMLVLVILGVRTCRRQLKVHMPLALFLLSSTLVALVFFVLPRYQTMMKVALVPFAAAGCLRVVEWLESIWIRQKTLKRR
jgi:hypothetical protein